MYFLGAFLRVSKDPDPLLLRFRYIYLESDFRMDSDQIGKYTVSFKASPSFRVLLGGYGLTNPNRETCSSHGARGAEGGLCGARGAEGGLYGARGAEGGLYGARGAEGWLYEARGAEGRLYEARGAEGRLCWSSYRSWTTLGGNAYVLCVFPSVPDPWHFWYGSG